MGLFDAKALTNSVLSAAGGLFTQYTGVNLTPAGSPPVQATLPATRTGTPAQDPIAGAGANGIKSTGDKNSGGLFNGSVSPALLIVGTLVAVAAIVMIARR